MVRNRIAILDGLRTPFVRSGGPLKTVTADDLAARVAGELLARSPLAPEAIDEVIFGNVAQPPESANVARVIALKMGLPASTIAHTVHRNCASGMQSITDAAMAIQSGRAEVILAGGTESMSRIPLLFGAQMTQLFINLMRARTFGRRAKTLASFRLAHLKPVIGLQLGLVDPICELNMGQTAEILAREFGITRAEQDAYALWSHQKAIAAQEDGRFDDELVPVIPPPAYDKAQVRDDGPNPDLGEDILASKRPYFDRQAGTVTAANSCPITDGAAAVIVTSESKARDLGVEPLGYLTGWAYAALDGSRMGLGPVYATAKLARLNGLAPRDYDLVELNEAFAAQVIANERAFASADFAREHLGQDEAVGVIDRETLNVNGGAIALGHPVGATGTRLVVTALRELRRRGGERALATLCVGGGQGAALSLEAA